MHMIGVISHEPQPGYGNVALRFSGTGVMEGTH